MLSDFKEKLKERLMHPLPGMEAQQLMAPSTSDNRRFNIEEGNDARLGAILILVFPREGKFYFPLIQRPDYDGVHAGQISFPGGKLEESDSDLIETALRESNEEIGIDPGEVEVLGTLTDLYITVSNFKVKPVIGLVEKVPEFIPDKSEVAKIIESDLNNLINKNLRKEKEIIVERNLPDIKFKHHLHAPYFDINGHVVWGATAMILSEFSAVMKEIN